MWDWFNTAHISTISVILAEDAARPNALHVILAEDAARPNALQYSWSRITRNLPCYSPFPALRVDATITDLKPLTYAFNAKPDPYSPREIRHLEYISQFTADIRYAPGSDNVVANALSRPDINALPPSTQLDLAKLANFQNGDPYFLPTLYLSPHFKSLQFPYPSSPEPVFVICLQAPLAQSAPKLFDELFSAIFIDFLIRESEQPGS
ncbi:LOW QUALITY PROTEIN: hypothetical protein T265_15149 [Opisthorchis viverrini]|uniref:Uncharacterized protein n=1 Tax=Opisthorchis viverrini TaxID=6198 RepID=A0A074Z2K8_OPIVI|nr:LOW QUALITY PROTEIN: hypothetical protein T265_15149 [Opisthorchis viverrini]KER21193.1 LOW QUALITY PROTEIN: hypothetical protein T265_15149 [Opisthorchis viverrini]